MLALAPRAAAHGHAHLPPPGPTASQPWPEGQSEQEQRNALSPQPAMPGSLTGTSPSGVALPGRKLIWKGDPIGGNLGGGRDGNPGE